MISFAISDEHVHDAKAGKELLKSVKEATEEKASVVLY
jgi:hypothetical protein